MLAPAACAALVGACYDFDATTRGGPLGDGGPPPDSGALDSGAADGTVSDAGTNDAAAPDASPGDGGFCATLGNTKNAVFFCDDFDEAPLPGSWNTYHEMSGTLTDTDAASVSPPSSLEEQTASLPLGQGIDVALRKQLTLPPIPSTSRFAFSLEPVTVDPAANATIVLVAIDFSDALPPAPVNRYSVQLSLTIDGTGAATMALGEQSGFTDGSAPYVNHPLPPTTTLAVGQFTDVAIEIQWSSATSVEGRVFLGAAQVLDVPLTMTVTPIALQIGVGTSYVTEPSPGWTLRFDNVAFTAN
jgi:hypothetical protein